MSESNGTKMLLDRLESMKKTKNYSLDSQEAQTEGSEIIKIREGQPGSGIRKQIELTLEPTKMGILGKKTRLTQEEYLDAISRFIQEESDSWEELRMKDQIRNTRDYIVAETMIKHCVKEGLIEEPSREMLETYTIGFEMRANGKNEVIGEAVKVILKEAEGLTYG
ncbi:hypothetical protein ACQR3P_29325 [Rhodococcus sp. IEGM1300]